jgi:hypothetical protein
MALPEAMLLIRGEVITDISNEIPHDNKPAKNNNNKNPTMRGI